MKSWNEIRKAATVFSKRWKGAYDEKSQAQSFLKEFFEVFGVDTVTQATFEHRVKFSDGSQGFVDCFWPSTILVEMKSKGKDLDAAFGQAMDYVRALPDQSTLPRAIVVSDFQTFRFYDLTKDAQLTTFKLADLRKYVTLFGYMIGGESEEIREQDPVNRKAAEKMAKLHDALKAIGYQGRELEVYLVRLLFCLFAEDTSIFKVDQFSNFIREKTAPDGSDLAIRIAELFQVLNTAPEKRLATRDEAVAAFPYVNGNLFGDQLQIPAFSAAMRTALLDCGALDWSKISPAIFGAMFQGVMDETKRHDLGAHYTSEENILKVIRPLFLDSLREEFDTICLLTGPSKRVKLQQFHDRIAALKFLDPACGCGNFLLIAYRELRRLEMDVLEELHKDDPGMVLDVSTLCKVNVSQFYGIEIEQFPAEIAKVALWLMDHLCNLEVADRFGQYFARIPIKASPHIVCANALTTDWAPLSPSFDYIFGNPPFLGKKEQTPEQKADMQKVFALKKPSSVLDFVTAWYKKAVDFTEGTTTECAFVSTNSICQGEHIPAFWNPYILPRNIHINFAHQTFKWSNEAKGKAAVHCVIVGFAFVDRKDKRLFVYDKPNGQPKETHVKRINPYLYDAVDPYTERRDKPVNAPLPMCYGNIPLDWGTLMLTAEERAQFIASDSRCEPLIKRCLGGDELLNGGDRYCLWLVDFAPSLLKSLPLVSARVEACREKRLASKDAGARKLGEERPYQFRDLNNPDTAIVIPKVSSERRKYVPLGFIDKSTVTTGTVLIVPNGTLYMFGVLSSAFHMAWLRAVGGRMELRYQYSKDLVYNNFIWPTVSDEARKTIETAAQGVLDARAAHPGQTLADLYDPLYMPPDLLKAHQHLDALVDKAYGKKFANDAERVAHLFDLYAAAVKGA
ncbi:MAG: class I SAM-dependent DNA methyltransferase [Kiritimatiellia bacterium]